MQIPRKRQAYDKFSKLYIWYNTPNNSTRRLEPSLTGDKNWSSKSAVESK